MKMEMSDNGLLKYEIDDAVEAFSTLRDLELPYPVLQAHQVHGDRIVTITDRNTTREDLEGVDALITSLPNFAIAARSADCVPILLFDTSKKVVAAVHSGWKGTLIKIAYKAIKRMEAEFGTRPDNVKAIIGPSIGPESFQVGEEVAQHFMDAGFPMYDILLDMGIKIPCTMAGGLHIDLWKANEIILKESGLKDENILIASIDTYTDTRFFSARREGGKCGRIINSIMIVQ